MRVVIVLAVLFVLWLAWRRYRVAREDEDFTRYDAAVRRGDIAAVIREGKHHIARARAEAERESRSGRSPRG